MMRHPSKIIHRVGHALLVPQLTMEGQGLSGKRVRRGIIALAPCYPPQIMK